MKATTLKKKSWHFWLADKGHHNLKFILSYKEKVDLCQYIRWVIFGAFLVTLASIGILILSMALLLVTYYDVEWIFNSMIAGHFVSLEPLGIFMLSVWCVVLFLLSVALFQDYKQKHGGNERKPLISDDAFVKIAYRKFKDKTCSYVEFE